jgi:hypothetical protein
MRRPFAAAFASVVFVIAAGCGDGGGTTITTREPQALPTLAISSGLSEVDQVLRAAVGRDVIELAGLTGYQKRPCRSLGEESPEPACRDGEDPGDEVEVLAATTCEDGWVRPENVPDAFRLSLNPGPPTVLAIFVPNTSEALFGGFGAGAAAVLSVGEHDDGEPRGVALYIERGRVVWIRNSCGNIDELLAPDNIASFIVEPQPGSSDAGGP